MRQVPRKLKRRLSRAEYRATFKELRGLIAGTGYKLTVRWHGSDFEAAQRRAGAPFPNTCTGATHAGKKQIDLEVFGRPARRLILHVLAHELRHAQHHVQRRFWDYYKPSNLEMWMFLVGKRENPPKDFTIDPRVGFLAERDCDSFANRFFKARGIAPYHTEYPYWGTMAYRLDEHLKALKKKKAQSED